MTRPKIKKAYFRRLTSLAPGEKLNNYPKVANGFSSKFEEWAQRPAAEQRVRVNGREMYCLADHESEIPAVTIFKPMSDDFITRYNRSNGEISELFTEDDDPDEVLAQASVFALDGRSGPIALMRNGLGAPSVNALELFLDEAAPLPPDRGEQPRWGSEPIIERSSVTDFKNFDGGATEVTMRFPTRRELFNTELEPGFVSKLEAYADNIGGDLEVTITAKLMKTGRQSSAVRKNYRRVLERDLEPVLRGGSRFSVKLLGDDGEQQIMNLIEERLSVDVEFEFDPDGARGLQQLKENVLSSLSDNLDRIKELYR